MRVILKPVGLVCVLVAFVALTFLAVRQSRMVDGKKEQTVTSAPGTQSVGADLVNAGFEEKYVPVQPFSQEGVVSGVVAAPWVDDSSWAQVVVDYSQDSDNPHEGKSCQKVVVTEVSTVKEARVQFVQELNLALNKSHRASCWIRADRTTEIDIALRQKPWPYRYYGVNKVKIGNQWKKIEVSGTPSLAGTTFLMLKISKPVTFWVDDAKVSQ
ncbi:MAG: hypothetical protein H7145_15475 [Akkermansiaceae bacterium]|nr:hypothetical protein [Armatimonadota bacterium]